MGRCRELSEFQRGTVIGCHRCKKSSREISSLLNITQSTASRVIRKWKCLGMTTTLPRRGRPRKLTERGQRMPKHIVQRGHQFLQSQSLQISKLSTSERNSECFSIPRHFGQFHTPNSLDLAPSSSIH